MEHANAEANEQCNECEQSQCRHRIVVGRTRAACLLVAVTASCSATSATVVAASRSVCKRY